jgi:hypothetical protein
MIHDKKYIENFLLEISFLQTIISIRAEELLHATKPLLGFRVRISGIEFEKDYVSINFVEDSNTDCPDSAFTELTIEHLAMEDDEWSAHIVEVTDRVRKRRQKDIDAELERQRNKDMAEYLALKTKLQIG